jgi:hypothetical protein
MEEVPHYIIRKDGKDTTRVPSWLMDDWNEKVARIAELEEENRELRQGMLRQPTFDNIRGLTPDRFPPGKFELVIACPSCGAFVPESQIKH